MDTRSNEMFADIDKHITNKKHAAMVKSWLGPYAIGRNQFFGTMSGVLSGGIASQRAEVAGKWESAMQNAFTGLGRSIPQIASAQKHLPEPQRATEKRLAGEEASFVQAAGKLTGIGAKVDVVIEMGLNLEKKSAELLDVWGDLEGRMKDAEQAMSYAQQDIDRAIEEAINDVAYQHKTTLEHAMNVAAVLEKLPADANPLTVLGEYGALARWLTALRHVQGLQLKAHERLSSRKATLHLELDRRGVGIVMFSELRRSVESFLEKVNVEASAAAVKAVREVMVKNAIDACVTPAQKADMTAFTKVLVDAVEGAHDKMVSHHDKFVAANSAIFFGMVGDRTLKILLNKERWKKAFYGVRISQLNSALRELYKFDYTGVPLRYYRGEMADIAKRRIRDAVGALYADIQRQDASLARFGVSYTDLVSDLERLGGQIQ